MPEAKTKKFKAPTSKEMAERWCNDERMNSIGLLVQTEIALRGHMARLTETSEDMSITKEGKETKLDRLKEEIEGATKNIARFKEVIKNIEDIEKDVLVLWK